MELVVKFPAAENEIFHEEVLVGNIFRQIRVNGKVCVINKIEIVDEGKMALITIDIPDRAIDIVFEEYDGFSL